MAKKFALMFFELVETFTLLTLIFLLLVLMLTEFALITEMFLDTVAITDVS